MTTPVRQADTDFYISAEATYGTTKTAAAADAVKVKSGGALKITETNNVAKLDEYNSGTNDPMAEVALAKDVSWTMGLFLRGGASQGVESDAGELIKTALAQTVTVATTVAASPSPTTTAFKLAADYLAANQIGWIEVEDANGVVIEKRHFAVVSKDGSAVLTIFPALANAPTAGDHVKAVIQYKPALTNAASVSLLRAQDYYAEWATGAKASKISLKFVRGQKSEIDFEGFAQKRVTALTTAISEDLTDVETDVDVYGAGIESGAILLIGTEEMYVTAVSATGKTLTVTRGHNSTSAAAHTSGDAIAAKMPTPTLTGSEILSLDGGVFVDSIAGVQQEIKVDECTVEIDTAAEPYTYFGDGGLAQGANYPAPRNIVITATVHFGANAIELMRQAKDNLETKFFIHAGITEGRATAIWCPKVTWEIPDLPDEKNQMMKVTFTSRSVLGTAGEDAFFWGM